MAKGLGQFSFFFVAGHAREGTKSFLRSTVIPSYSLSHRPAPPKTDGSQLPTNRGLGFSKKRCPATTTKAPRTDLGIKPRRPNHPPSRPMGFPTSARAQAPSTDPPNLTFPTISPIPTYYPTEREFQDPARYIASIQAEASR